MADPASDPYAALLSGIQQAEGVAQQENPYPILEHGVAGLKMQPLEQWAHPGTYALEKGLQGLAGGLLAGGGIGYQQDQNTKIINAVTGNNGGSLDDLDSNVAAPIKNSGTLFGSLFGQQQKMKLFDQALKDKSDILGHVASGDLSPEQGQGLFQKFHPELGSGSNNSSAATSDSTLPFKPKEIAGKTTELTQSIANSDPGKEYEETSRNFRNMVSGLGQDTKPASISLIREFAKAQDPKGVVRPSTFEQDAAAGAYGEAIKDLYNEAKTGGLSPEHKAQLLAAVVPNVSTSYNAYKSYAGLMIKANQKYGINPSDVQFYDSPFDAATLKILAKQFPPTTDGYAQFKAALGG